MTLKYDQKLSDLKSIDNQPGTLEWIGVRIDPRGTVQTPDQVECICDKGLVGDHRSNKSGSKRQITLMQYEYLEVIAKLIAKPEVDPTLIRRNCLVSGINVNTLRDQFFTIGEVLLEGTGYCHPCSRMEENLGTGGYNAMRGHGGITAKILSDGIISIGDKVIRKLT